MLILSIDSTAKEASAALLRDGVAVGEVNLRAGNTHSEQLLPAVDFLLRSLGLSPSDPDVFACAAGPGSFTGVRIGAATIKGLAFGRGKCCAAVSTLEALAENLRGLDGIACAVMDARRGQVYTATFDVRGDELVRLTPDEAMSVDELGEMLAKHNIDCPVYLVGDGYNVAYPRLCDKLDSLAPTPEPLRTHSAASVAAVARRMAERGELTDDVSLSPSYLRLSQAEREYNEKHGIE